MNRYQQVFVWSMVLSPLLLWGSVLGLAWRGNPYAAVFLAVVAILWEIKVGDMLGVFTREESK